MKSTFRRRLYVTAPLLFVGLVAWSPAKRRTQPATTMVFVVDELSRRALANADVVDLETGNHRFTNEGGEVRLLWPANGQIRLRVRQVGYQPMTRTITRENTSERGTFFPLKRVAYTVSPVRAMSKCITESDSESRALSVAVLEQLRQGAEKYEQFRRSYPFEARVPRRTVFLNSPRKRLAVAADTLNFESDDWETKYRPGKIVEHPAENSFKIPVLFLSTLADTVFWEHHCFVARGVEDLKGSRVIRLEFSPAADVNGPDWSGAALLDSANSTLRRVEFSVGGLAEKDLVRRVEGYTTFRSPSPFVVMPDSTLAIWWFRAPDNPKADWGKPDYAQSIHVAELKYRKGKPPAVTPDSAAKLTSS